jgi:hypothetical protein
MGGGKGGSADQSGMYMAMASAQEAQLAYSLGSQQLQWAKDQFAQEQPLVSASETALTGLTTQETAASKQSNEFAKQQEDLYNQVYAPEEVAFIDQANDWASPANTALVQGEAQTNVANQANAGLSAAESELRGFGVNPSSPKYAGLGIGARAIAGAGEAAAGTTAAQNLKLQQLGLESQAINTGRGLVNSAAGLTGAGTGAATSGAGSAAGAASTAQSNLQTGSNAMTAPTAYINAGTNAMNTYVNAVNGYNQAQLGYAQLNANTGMSQMAGIGSVAGGILGLLARGGSVMHFDTGGPTTGNGAKDPKGQGAKQAIPVPHGATPGGGVPVSASPSGGSMTDDVDAKLTAHEFVIPKDVAIWKGHEHFVKAIDKAREEQHQLSQRKDIGGEKVSAIPNPNPAFQSQPFNAHIHNAANARDAMQPPPSMHPSVIMQQTGIPARRAI